MRYRKDNISKHETFDPEEFAGMTSMGKIIEADKFSPQPVELTDQEYADLTEAEYVSNDEEMIPVEPIQYEDRGLRDKPRPGSLFPNGDAY